MPKAQNIEEKYLWGYKVDKEDDKYAFNDQYHIYFSKDTGEKHISVTQLISNYCAEFDENFWTAYKALESLCDGDIWSVIKPKLLSTKKFTDKTLEYISNNYGLDKEQFYQKRDEIKAEYKQKRDAACERGTNIHLAKELQMYGKRDFDFTKYGFKNLYGEFTCIQNHNILDLDRGVYPEFLIGATFGDLTILGQMDLLVIDGLNAYIGDYKTNREIKKTSYFDQRKKRYQMMKAPLNNLMDSTLVHYQLQLSLYARMLQQRNPKYNIKQLQIIHTDHDNNETLYTVDYLKDDVDRMIKDYAKKEKIRKELERDIPFIR